MNILLTGGAGYIGSHTALAFIEAGHQVTIADNLLNSSVESIRRVERLTGQPINFHQLDLLDLAGLDGLFTQHAFDAVV
ncbi:MAG: UDP-glucose 4-epimerase, partial [Candidatus Azotimanducaceae bacterium]